MNDPQSVAARTGRRRRLALAAATRGHELAVAAAAEAATGGVHAAVLAYELAIGHHLMMQLAAEANSFIERIDTDGMREKDRSPLEAVRLAGGAARLMDRYRRGLLALPLLRGPAPCVLQRPAVVGWPEPKRVEAAARTRKDLPLRANRGWLRHGNQPGDFLAAPRCGACTRAGGACRQPAMRNGRCRFHGGKSTGPRTAAGLQRSRTARLIHGGHGEALRALRSAAAAAGRNLARLTPAARGVLAGHGLHPTDRPSRPVPPGATRIAVRRVVGQFG
jgi:hypothetical protein